VQGVRLRDGNEDGRAEEVGAQRMSTQGSNDGVLIVGASLAGATTATALRSLGFDGRVTLLGAEPQLPYERPGLSKGYLKGTLGVSDLLVHDADFYAANAIDLELGRSATGLDLDRGVVTATGGEGLGFGTLVIATGAANVRPPIPGIDLPGVHQLRTLTEADALRADAASATSAVVIGMGFIGTEVTATLVGLGLDVVAVDALPGPLWGPLGPELSGVARRWHEARGARILGGQSVTALHAGPDGRIASVELATGERLPADLVVVGVGVRPATGWLADAPLHLNAGAVGVDADGWTGVAGVYAAGDVTATWDSIAGVHRRHEHWSSAIDQGRRAARRIVGLPAEPPKPPYFWSEQYDKTVQYAGNHDGGSDVVISGDLTAADSPLTAQYLHDGRLTAVLSVNDGKEFRRTQRQIGELVLT
jgi:3-phenylpropionate/trans-cinnamate dioxygenase ferredoxin reductase subunit